MCMTYNQVNEYTDKLFRETHVKVDLKDFSIVNINAEPLRISFLLNK